MSRQLTSQTNLENLRKEAKRWLKALRAGDADARARLALAHPGAPGEPTLRDVQFAIAREFGLAGWIALKETLEQGRSPEQKQEILVHRFLDNACPDHHVRGKPDHVRAQHTALRLLDRYPEIAQANFYTAIVTGDLDRVRRTLDEQPDLVNRKSAEPSAERSEGGGSHDLYRDWGAKGWQPLLYLAFTRLPLPSVNENAVEIARLLLDRGADPTVYFQAGGSHYTPLVGVIGDGEEGRPPHPSRDQLVPLLLERGADPYDVQVLYDLGFGDQILWYLQQAYAESVRRGRKSDWDDPEWSMLYFGDYGSGARWHLEKAIANNDADLARWCLEHGANPNSLPAPDPRFDKSSLYEMAVRAGRAEIAELLLQHGAVRKEPPADTIDALVAASLRLDRAEVHRLVQRHPEYLQSPEPLLAAAGDDRADVVTFLLDLGMSTELMNERKERPLHIAAYNNALNVARLLIERGAEIDPVETNFGNTPIGGAVYYQHPDMIDLIAHYSRNIWELVYAGKVDRVRELIEEDPERARIASGGHTPLMWLPAHDEELALEMAQLFLEHGADASLRNDDGMTAADRAEQIGMFRVAALLR